MLKIDGKTHFKTSEVLKFLNFLRVQYAPYIIVPYQKYIDVLKDFKGVTVGAEEYYNFNMIADFIKSLNLKTYQANISKYYKNLDNMTFEALENFKRY